MSSIPDQSRGALSALQRVRRFLAARFDPKSHFGLGFTVMLVIFALALWTLSSLLDAVLDNATLVRLDTAIESWFHSHATPAGLAIFNVVTQLGMPVVDVLIVVVAIYLWRKGDRLLLWNWLAATLGSKVIEHVLKLTVHRSRPEYGPEYLHGHSYSFPSGHTMNATICYLFLAYLAATHQGTTHARGLAAYGAAGLLILSVAFSRLYLGVHYPSDVLGGIATAVAWLSICGATRRFVAGRRASEGWAS